MTAEDGAATALTKDEGADDALFEGLMVQVGMKGRFQTQFNMWFNLVFTVLIAMPYLNIVLAMSVPDHWCKVPGREDTNYTLEEWKELTIPRQVGGREADAFSKCLMYNASVPEVLASPREANDSRNAEVVGCQHGWEYDTTWYSLTAPSQEDWVCDKALYVSNTFAFSRAGDVVGSFIFGQLGDTIGRRPVFFLTLILLVVGRCMSALTAGNYSLFLAASVIGSLSTSAAFQSPLAIGMEVSASDKRAYLAMLQCLGWTLGICIMPLVAWVSGDWVVFMLISTLPCALFLFSVKHFTESPRWLASRGKTVRCRQVLSHIAEQNGTALPAETMATLEKIAGRRDKVYGVASLFSSWRLAKNTMLMSISWVISSLTYYTLILNISNLSGNPFLNFLWQSLVELPGYIVGKALSDRYGRRWTQAGTFFILTLGYIILIAIINDPRMEWLTTLLVVFAKYSVTVTFYIVYLQAMEIYPTCVRQTGTAMASLAGSGLGIIGPYIVYLGVSLDIRYPYIIMGVMALVGGIASSFLPETLNQKLPESLGDAQRFGHDQKFWQIDYRSQDPADIILK